MAFTQENVADSNLSGFTSDLVNLSTGIADGVLDSENNLYVLDDKKLHFGDNKEFHLRLSSDEGSVLFGDLSENTLFAFHGDGSVGLKTTTGNFESLQGNITYRADGLYVQI